MDAHLGLLQAFSAASRLKTHPQCASKARHANQAPLCGIATGVASQREARHRSRSQL